MESLNFEFAGRRGVRPFTPVLVGVVGSGNLEVLVEPSSDVESNQFHIETSARGFGAIWQAVVSDFQQFQKQRARVRKELRARLGLEP